MSWTSGLKESKYFLALATKNYLQDLREATNPVHSQVLLAKRLKKPVVLLIEESLTKLEIEELKEYFRGLTIVLELTFNRESHESMERTVQVIAEKL